MSLVSEPRAKARQRPKQAPVRTQSSKRNLPLSRPMSVSRSETALFPSNKRDKRTIKHSNFISKIEKSKAQPKQRRRPNKQLVANLEALVDALPELEDNAGGETQAVVGQATIHRESLKSRPGVMKRRQNLEKLEKARFGLNLAQMAGRGEVGAGAPSISVTDRWAALKSHVLTTSERKAEFVER